MQQGTALDGGETYASIDTGTPSRRIEDERKRQHARFAKLDKSGLLASSDMDGQQAGLAEVKNHCKLDNA